VRGIFFDEASGRAVVGRLQRDGYAAELVRERLAGEDDDEDHPWAVLTDAPQLVLEIYVDEHDGWLDDDSVPGPPTGGTPATPLPLPAQPLRTRRPDGGH
jgi:8-oxo-dGTP diphosphatase